MRPRLMLHAGGLLGLLLGTIQMSLAVKSIGDGPIADIASQYCVRRFTTTGSVGCSSTRCGGRSARASLPFS